MYAITEKEMKEFIAMETCMVCDIEHEPTPVIPGITKEQEIVFAIWKCPKCDSEVHQTVGEINPEEAEVL